MGFRTEINYIVKSNTVTREFVVTLGDTFIVSKRGQRVYIMNQPLMFADVTWCVRGMCEVVAVAVQDDETIVTARMITVFTDEESRVATRILAAAYEALSSPRNEAESSTGTAVSATAATAAAAAVAATATAAASTTNTQTRVTGREKKKKK